VGHASLNALTTGTAGDLTILMADAANGKCNGRIGRSRLEFAQGLDFHSRPLFFRNTHAQGTAGFQVITFENDLLSPIVAQKFSPASTGQ